MKTWVKANKTGLSIMLLAAVLIGAGIFRNEVGTVFQKASAICLECIGIG